MVFEACKMSNLQLQTKVCATSPPNDPFFNSQSAFRNPQWKQPRPSPSPSHS